MGDSDRKPIDPKDWNRQPDRGESFKAYEAFLMYRDMGPGLRSVKETAANWFLLYPPATSSVQNWASKNRWESRAAAYDDHQRSIQSLHVAKVNQIDVPLWSRRRDEIMEQEFKVAKLLMDQAQRHAERENAEARELKDVAAVAKASSEMFWRLFGAALPSEAADDGFDPQTASKEDCLIYIARKVGDGSPPGV